MGGAGRGMDVGVGKSAFGDGCSRQSFWKSGLWSLNSAEYCFSYGLRGDMGDVITLLFASPRSRSLTVASTKVRTFVRSTVGLSVRACLSPVVPLCQFNMMIPPFTAQDLLICTRNKRGNVEARERERAGIRTQTALPNIPPTVNQPLQSSSLLVKQTITPSTTPVPPSTNTTLQLLFLSLWPLPKFSVGEKSAYAHLRRTTDAQSSCFRNQGWKAIFSQKSWSSNQEYLTVDQP